MMPVYVIADNIYSPLGTTSEKNFGQLLAGTTGIRRHEDLATHPTPFYASLFDTIETDHGLTRFEQLLVNSITEALNTSGISISDPATGLIISTTKGNIGLLEHAPVETGKLPLHQSAKKVAEYFKLYNEPLVVSNACISGLSALITGKRLIEAGIYKNVVVAGADLITAFVFAGFNAFQAISPVACRPYDKARDGVTLGEAAGTIILSDEPREGSIQMTGAAGSNDANHISGPSRTGVELSIAMQKAMKMAGLAAENIDFISAHGTATVYNDEMEAKAITLAGLQRVPVNSLKGYFGHTLGAAGIIESVIAIHSLNNDMLIATKGFEELGVPMPIRVIRQTEQQAGKHCLKTASGFGGCNAAVIWSRN